ncbi:MAG: alpha/beta hydrolase [Chitinophagaceae bacterium]|nr:alpha/beta hydrolase [Chitinophagaceae bacterium]MCW5927244.1 alpha/beta hydrolase [Chitinophagaceae bacterium]
MILRTIISSLFLFQLFTAPAQTIIPLYEKVPGMLPVPSKERYDSARQGAYNVTHPTVTVYLPEKDKATGAAVIVCPGGGYGMLVMGNEGHKIAKYFADHGVAAFVLKYRLPDEERMKNKSHAPLQDAQSAIQLVRQRAGEWGIDAGKIGIMGFSAGGHLASSASVHFSDPVIPSNGVSLRPDFTILVYPVISMGSLGHSGSRENLLGKNPSPQLIEKFSSDLQVTKETPPALLIHSSNDKGVPVYNSINYYSALQKNGVLAEMHIYPVGDHGFVLQWPLEDWMPLSLNFMKSIGILR